jgi:hypothetical protein
MDLYMCVICFESMDMKTYQDEEKQTSTCFKLDCGHAYHTACIIRCLSTMNQQCPHCNKDKTPLEQLTREGLARKLVGEIKKDPDIKFLISEFKESTSEYHSGIVTLKKDIKEFITKRKEELQIDEKRKYMLDCLSKIQTTSKTLSQTKGPQYIAALHTGTMRRYWRGTTFERLFFGVQYAYTITRLKTPRLYMNLY